MATISRVTEGYSFGGILFVVFLTSVALLIPVTGEQKTVTGDVTLLVSQSLPTDNTDSQPDMGNALPGLDTVVIRSGLARITTLQVCNHEMNHLAGHTHANMTLLEHDGVWPIHPECFQLLAP